MNNRNQKLYNLYIPPYRKSFAFYQSELEKVENEIHDYKFHNQEVPIIPYNKKLFLLNKLESYEAAKILFEKLKENADIITVTEMFAVYADMGEFRLAENLFSFLIEQDIKIDISFLNMALQSYLENNKFEKAANLLKRIEENEFNVDLDITTYSIKCKMFLRQRKFTECEKCIEFIEKEGKKEGINLLSIGYFDVKQHYYFEIRNFKKLEKVADQLINSSLEVFDKIEFLFSTLHRITRLRNKNPEIKELCQKIFISIELLESRYHLSSDIYSLDGKLRYYLLLRETKSAETLYSLIKNKFSADPTIYKVLINVFDIHIINGEIYKAEKIWQELKEIEKKFSLQRAMHLNYCLIDFFIKKEDLTSAKELYAQIKTKKENKYTTRIYSSMLSVYVKELNQAESEYFFNQLRQKAVLSTYACNLMTALYNSLELYDLAEGVLQEFSSNNLHPNPSTYNCIIELYNRKYNGLNGSEIFKNLSGNLTIRNYLYLAKNITHNFSWSAINFAEIIFSELRNFIAVTEEDPSDYRYHLRQVIKMHIKLVDKMKYHIHSRKLREKHRPTVEKYQTIIHKLAGKLATLLSDPKQIFSITAEEAALVNSYFPEFNLVPNGYQPLSKRKLKESISIIASKLDHELRPLNDTMQFTIKEIEASGHAFSEAKKEPDKEKITEYKISDSTYYHMTGGKDFYLIIKFNSQPKKIPVYISFSNKIYATTFIFGSKLKSKITEGKYLSLIAVPLDIIPLLKPFFPYVESQAYGQRMLLPETANQVTKGIKGCFSAAIIPDSMNYTYLSWIILQDGCSAMKKSVFALANATNHYFTDDYTKKNRLHISYQHLQYYEAENFSAAVDELVKQNKPYLLEIKRKLEANEKISANEVEELYAILSGGLPKWTGIGIPVAENKLYLPFNLEKMAGNGVFVVRDPADGKKIQVFTRDQIVFSDTFNTISAVQTTFIGYHRRDGYKHLMSFFSKDCFVIVPDDQWPADFNDCDMLLSASNIKIHPGWTDKEKKYLGQHPTDITRVKINGVLVFKQHIEGKKLIGISKETAHATTGDWDGDPYSISPIPKTKKGEPSQLAAMIVTQNKYSIDNFKIDKTVKFSEPNQIDNAKKIIELTQHHFMEYWTVIACVFLSLTLLERSKVAKILAAQHQLKIFLGENWQSKLRQPLDDNTIVMTEILKGMKYGEDGLKTEIPTDVIAMRLQEYQQEFRKINPKLSVPYGKGLLRDLQETILSNEQVDCQALINVLTKLHMRIEATYQGPANIVSETQKCLLELLYTEGTTTTSVSLPLSTTEAKPTNSTVALLSQMQNISAKEDSVIERKKTKKHRRKKAHHQENSDTSLALDVPTLSTTTINNIYNTFSYFASVPSSVVNNIYQSTVRVSTYITHSIFSGRTTPNQTTEQSEYSEKQTYNF